MNVRAHLTPNIHRVIRVASDAIRALEAEGIGKTDIALGFALALQRLPAQALALRQPAATEAVQSAVRFIADVVKAASRG